MVLEGPGRLTHYEAARILIYVSKIVGTDSAFPFKAGDALWVRIDAENERLIIEKDQRKTKR
jgi:hypothetical protein